ncbi:MAG: N-acetylmuramoyl-L-alanine amidase [Nitrospirae bacterium]|nr:N-acetylmuramoyl-L-alanine amidase [Nitrospirota bacterium]
MMPAIAGKREFKVKQAILKGVYEDNLKVVGKCAHPLAKKPSLFRNKILLFVAMSLITLLGYGTSSNLSSSPVKQFALSPANTRTPSPPSSEKTLNPSDYAAFLNGREPLSRVFGLGVRTIMIDPGHGGSDSGTSGKMGTHEKDMVLDIAKRLRERLRKHSYYTVLMTREQDVAVPLNKRVELANAAKADLFVSIHLNYLPSKPINMIETYYFGPSSDPKTLKLAEQENAGSRYGMSDFREIIEKIGETIKLQESKQLATSIQKKLFVNSREQNGNVYDFGIKRAPFVVLLGVDVPAVLAEVSCLSNREEEIELNTESHRENIARYLEAGILDYLSKGDLRYEAKREQ